MADDKDRGKVTDMADTEIPQLPIDVIIHVMSYLSVSDRMSAGLVNQTWREASLALKFVDQQALVLERSRTEKLGEMLSVLQHSTRPFLHFVFHEVELKRNMVIWEQYGPRMKTLVLLCCHLSEKTLVDILKCCTSLRVLRIDACRECLISGRLLEDENDVNELAEKFVHLEELSLSCNRFLSDALFNRLVGICPNLKSLSLMDCQISFHSGLYKKFYPENAAAPGASNSVLTFVNIMGFLRHQANKLKHLNFGHTLIDSARLATLSALEGLKLRSLILEDCYQLRLAGIKELARHQTRLKVLDISFCSGLTDSSLICICRYLKKLEVLGMKKCEAITDFGIWHISLLKDLKELNISENRFLSGDYITRGLCCEPSSALYTDRSEDGGLALENVAQRSLQSDSVPVKYIRNEKLEVFYANNALRLDQESIQRISLSCPNLRALELNGCSGSVTDETMRVILKNLVRLQILKISWCHSVTDAGLMEQSELDEPPGLSLSRLRCLRELDLSGCRLTDISLKQAFAFPELRVLNLSDCRQISDVGLNFLSQHNPAIEELNLNSCYDITDIGISFLAERLRRLKRLLIQGCFVLTDESLRSIKLHCPTLRYLDVRYCHGISPAEVESLTHVYVEWMKHTDDVQEPYRRFRNPEQHPRPCAPPAPPMPSIAYR